MEENRKKRGTISTYLLFEVLDYLIQPNMNKAHVFPWAFTFLLVALKVSKFRKARMKLTLFI